ncbi:MAG: hypothetical protein Q7J60_12125, partial [Bradyrhizobium sp.]|nr:hypothetical protein [Bradyrhizobium sp.]
MRRDTPRRITPERMAFHKQRAKQLRDEAWRDMWQALWRLLKKIARLLFVIPGRVADANLRCAIAHR